MRSKIKDFFIKPLLALAVAIPAMSMMKVNSAEAGHKNRRAAIIAGAIIGGAIAYNHYKRRGHYYQRGHYGYAQPRYYKRGYYGHRYHGKRYYGHRHHNKRYYGKRYYGKRYYGQGHRFYRSYQGSVHRTR
ncbi:MAG: hypothetical protein AAF217_14940 [Pseudomonadota bacterium]